MNRAKKIFKDILLFALASFGPKMISFFLIPLYTSYLSTTDYGTMELLNTIYSLLLPILTLDISDAIMIYTIECKNTEREDLPMYIGKRIVGVSSVILIGILAILVIFWRLKNIKIYCLYIFAQYFLNAVYNNYLAFFKGRNKVNCIVIGSIISSVVTIISNIAFVFVFKWGLYGLLFATVLASSFSVTYFFLVRKTDNKKIGTIEDSREFKKKMLCYSIPLIFTGIAWWINSSSDRLFISVANKIPAIITACHNVIFQALQLSVFNEIKSNDADVYLKKLYHIYSMVMVTVCSILILMDKTIATLLFKKDFFIAWHYAPALLISTVFFSISGYIITIAAAAKATKLIAKATVLGAVVNTILNLILIPYFELYGAVIATLIGYFFIWLTIILGVEKKMGIKFGIVFSCINYAVLIIQWVILLVEEEHVMVYEIILLMLILCLNGAVIKETLSGIYNAIINKTNKDKI